MYDKYPSQEDHEKAFVITCGIIFIFCVFIIVLFTLAILSLPN